MKTIFTLSLFIFSQILIGQINLGRYKIITDSTSIQDSPLVERQLSVEITINKDNTFKYSNKSSASCLLWHDITGVWEVKNKALYLVDSVDIDLNSEKFDIAKRITVYKIENDKLTFINQFFNKDDLGYVPSSNLFGNFIFEKRP